MSTDNIKLPYGLWIASVQQLQLHIVLVTLVVIVALYLKGVFGGIPAAWTFFTHRYDFMEFGFKKARRNAFSFSILDVCVSSLPSLIPLFNNSLAAHYHRSQGYKRTQGFS
jgi:hypothetical protein